MVIGIVQWVIISLVLIMLVHHLYSFFKNTLTVPKVKDLVHQPSQLYKEIEETLEQSNMKNNNTIKLSSANNIDEKEMKTELKNFFNELSQNKSNTMNSMNSMNSINSINTSNSNNVSSFASFPQMNEYSKNLYTEV